LQTTEIKVLIFKSHSNGFEFFCHVPYVLDPVTEKIFTISFCFVEIKYLNFYAKMTVGVR